MSGNRIKYWRNRRNLTQAELGELVGMHQNQVGKLEKGEQMLNTHHLRLFSEALKVPVIAILAADMVSEPDSGFEDAPRKEAEKVEISAEPHRNTRDDVEYLLHDSPRRTPWRLNSDNLAGVGYRKGDLLILDQDIKPKSGDIVCIQHVTGDDAETLWRIYEPPFFVAAPLGDPKVPPLLHDPRNITIMGTVACMLRENAA